MLVLSALFAPVFPVHEKKACHKEWETKQGLLLVKKKQTGHTEQDTCCYSIHLVPFVLARIFHDSPEG